ncbi:MAG: hypothetical protein WDZ69_01915 [Candidatus Pacearchaeota archaeon]
MKKAAIILTLILILIPLVSAEIIINQQPKETYSLGDVISIPVTVKTSSGISGNLNMDLICNGMEENFYKNGISLSAGEEKRVESSLVLTKNVIGEMKGECVIKAYVEEDSKTTQKFKISNKINIEINTEKTSFNPEETIRITGEAVKENGQAANGFIEASIINANKSEIEQLETINNGFFSIDIALPQEIMAGLMTLKLEAYETDSRDEKTNKGTASKSIRINQVPTSLEIVFDLEEIEPGEDLRIKPVLHDQTGERINSTSTITIKNSNDETIHHAEVPTDEFYDFRIANNELPSEWMAIATSSGFEKESKFTILEKKEIIIEITNKTLTITNTGNVLYNETALIRIGDESLNVDVYLEVGESKNYLISAPDGEYNVEVIAGEETISQSMALTGNAIEIKEISNRAGSLMRYPAVWIFAILILGLITFIVFKRGYQRTFIGYISSRIGKKDKKEKEDKTVSEPISKGALVNSKNRAELSLSIKGSKQDASVMNIHIKNLKEVQSKQGNAKETLQKIVDMAESQKAITYESHNNLFLIFAPIKTKTFKNEKTSLDISNKAVEILKNHNKMFKQKIDYGISLEHGTIIVKEEKDSIKFMTLGNLAAVSKKIASISEGEVLLSEKINDKLRSHLKTEKHEKGNLKFYSIKEMKNPEEHKKFIRGFLERQKDK